MSSPATHETNVEESHRAEDDNDRRQEMEEVGVDSQRHSFIVQDNYAEEEGGVQERTEDMDGAVTIDLGSKRHDTHHIDRGYAWVIAVACFAVQFLVTGFVNSIGLFFVEIQKQFDSSSTMTSLIIGIQEATSSITSFTFLVLVLKRTSPRVGCLFGCLCLTVGVAGNFFATSAEFIIFTLGVCLGMALGTAYVGSVIVLSDFFVKRRALVTSIVTTGASLGGMIMPLLARYFLDNYGFHGGFLLLGGILSHSFLFSMLLIPVTSLALLDKEQLNASEKKSEDSQRTDKWVASNEGENVEIECCVKSLEPGDKCHSQNCVCGNDDSGKDKELQVLISSESEEQGRSTRRHTNLPNKDSDRQGSVNEIHGKLVSTTIHQSESTNLQNSSDNNCPFNDVTDKLLVKEIEFNDSKRHGRQIQPFNEIEVNSISNERQTCGPMLLTDGSVLSSSRRTLSQIPDHLFNSTSTFLHSIADLRSVTFDDISQAESTSHAGKSSWCDACSRFSRTVRTNTLMRSTAFWMMCLFLTLTWMGFMISFTYIAALAKERGLADDDVAFLISLLNILDLPGRLLPGIIINTGYLKPSSMCVLPLAALGLVGYFTSFMHSYESLLGLIIVYGVFGGVYASMQTLIVIEVVGLRHYHVALAVCYLAMSFGTTSFFPIAGMMKDNTGTYSTPYYYLSTFQLLGAAILLCLPALKRFDARRGLLQ